MPLPIEEIKKLITESIPDATIEIKDLIRKGKIAEVGEQLLNHCLERMLNPNPPEPSKPDDLSFIVYRP